MGSPVICNNKEYPELNNFYPCEFIIDNKTWNSTEQYYQAMKSDDIYYKTKIRKETDALECWKMGQKVKIKDDWEKIKVDVMYKANYEKFKQNKKLRDILLSIKGEIYTYSTPFWTIQNKIILETLKEELRWDAEEQ